MPASSCRLIPTQSLSGPLNMAADELMLQSADRGQASLRFYTWSQPTLSLGYFQPADGRLADPNLKHVAWVRRPSGGAAIMHHLELTYCLALPVGMPWQPRGTWICRFHGMITDVLQSFGVASRSVVCGEEKKLGEFLCFLHQTPGDLLSGSSKIVGSAQRKLRGALMQHGSILLKRSEHAPVLPGIDELSQVHISADELAGRLTRRFAEVMSWELDTEPFRRDELNQIEQIAREKYSTPAWNEKR